MKNFSIQRKPSRKTTPPVKTYTLPCLAGFYNTKNEVYRAINVFAKSQEESISVELALKHFEKFKNGPEFEERLTDSCKILKRLMLKEIPHQSQIQAEQSRIKNYLVRHGIYLALLGKSEFEILELSEDDFMERDAKLKAYSEISQKILKLYNDKDFEHVELPTNPEIEECLMKISECYSQLKEYKKHLLELYIMTGDEISCVRREMNVEIEVKRLTQKVCYLSRFLNLRPIHYMKLSLKHSNYISSLSTMKGVIEYHLRCQLKEFKDKKRKLNSSHNSKRKPAEIIAKWLSNNPHGGQRTCSRETNIPIATVNRHWPR